MQNERRQVDHRSGETRLKNMTELSDPGVELFDSIADRRRADEASRQVAYDFHDGLLQIIFAADMRLDHLRAKRSSRNDWIDDQLNQISQMLKEAIREGRQLLSGLHPSTTDPFSLSQRVKLHLQHLDNYEGWTHWELDLSLGDWRGEPAVEMALFRIIQEALTNARKHSRTVRVKVALGVEDDSVRLEIRDWGQGFDVGEAMARAAVGQSFGLIGMQERARLLGGVCRIVSEPGRGALITVTIPQFTRARAAVAS
jgi:signal transduction histidine kinase